MWLPTTEDVGRAPQVCLDGGPLLAGRPRPGRADRAGRTPRTCPQSSWPRAGRQGDVALAAYRAELAELPEGREVARAELRRLIAAAEGRITAMERTCAAQPRQMLDRLLREMERYLDYVRFDADVPGAAAQYRHLYLATRRRVHWLRDRMPAEDRPDWSLPAASHSGETKGAQ